MMQPQPSTTIRPERPSAVQEFARLVTEYEQQSSLAKAHYDARLAVSTTRADLQALETAAERATVAHVAFRRSLDEVYRNPDHARQAFLTMAEKRGMTQATYEMRDRPESFGKLVTVTRTRAFGMLRYADDGPARSAAAATSEQGRSAVLAEQRLREVTAEVHTRRLGAEHAPALRTVAQFERALADIYQDPRAARRAFENAAERYGADRAAAHFVDQPWRYGPLRDSPMVEGASRVRPHPEAQAQAAALGAEAVRAARDLPAAEVKIVREMHAIPTVIAERIAGGTFAARVEQRERQLADYMAKLPGAKLLEQQVRHVLHSLTPAELQQVHQLLTASQRALVSKLKETAKEVLLGQDGRER